MNIMTFDTREYNLHEAILFFEKALEMDNTDNTWILLPRGMELMENVDLNWMRMIRDQLNREIEKCELNMQN
jgi:hypothetical protein